MDRHQSDPLSENAAVELLVSPSPNAGSRPRSERMKAAVLEMAECERIVSVILRSIRLATARAPRAEAVKLGVG
jgi:hypothetical protein